jgi:hypothetical protein
VYEPEDEEFGPPPWAWQLGFGPQNLTIKTVNKSGVEISNFTPAPSKSIFEPYSIVKGPDIRDIENLKI